METLSGESWLMKMLKIYSFILPSSHLLTCLAFLSLLKTILVGLHAKPFEKTKNTSNFPAPGSVPVTFRRENCSTESKEAVRARNDVEADGLRSKINSMPLSLPKKNTHEPRKSFDNSGSNTDMLARKSAPSPNNLQKTVKGRDNSEEVSEVHHDTSDAFPTEVTKTINLGFGFFFFF